MATPLIHQNLKRGLYTPPQFQGEFERYVIENEDDLKAFLEVFSFLRTILKNNLKKGLDEGHTIIVNDNCGYCFETKDTTNQHPSHWYRVKLLN